MAAIGLAIIGKNNSPLYVREFLSEHDTESSNSSNGYDDDYDDEAVLFGLTPNPPSTSSNSNIKQATTAASARCWFVLQTALDRLEQLTKTPDGKKKTTNNSSSNSSSNNNANFVGLLLPLEETRVYGYVTNTQIKFVLIVEDEGPNTVEATEHDTLLLLEELHELYVREVMNPFQHCHNFNTGSNNTTSGCNNHHHRLSQKFDETIQKHIANFNFDPPRGEPERRYGVAKC